MSHVQCVKGSYANFTTDLIYDIMRIELNIQYLINYEKSEHSQVL